MKNISRRVFIKGLAVAGVAAAASTVLAGCNTNMIPGVDDGKDDTTEETPSNSKVMTFADPADETKTLTLTFGKLIKGDADYAAAQKDTAVIKVVVDSKLDAAIDLNKTAPASADTLYMVSNVYADNIPGNKVKVKDAGLGANAGASLTVGSKSYDLTLEELDGVSSVTIEVIMYQTVGTSGAGKYEVSKQTVTYTL